MLYLHCRAGQAALKKESGRKGERRMFTDRKKLIEIAPDRIVPNPAQPRLDFPEAELQSLAESIRQNGVLQPILVRRDRDRYILIAGERRWRACRMAGLKTIPAVVQDISLRDSAVLALVENLQRSDLNFFEEAAAIYNLMQDRSMTQEETAKRLGMSQPALSNKLRLLQLTGEEQRIILQGGLTERHARCLLRVKDPIRRAQLLNDIIKRDLNVARTEALVQMILTEAPEKKPPKRTFIAKDLRLFLNTIDHAINAMHEAGVQASAEKTETDDYFEWVVRIPKQNSSTR